MHVHLNLSEDPCVLSNNGVCADDQGIKHMRKFLFSADRTAGSAGDNIVEQIKNILNVTDEIEIWKSPEFRNIIGDSVCDDILKKQFKPVGPAHSTELLTNNHIDSSLAQWSKNSQELFRKKFYHIPYQMIDFNENQTELSNFDPAAVKREGYDCFGVVLNTDVLRGKGKHWFCIYGDLAHSGTRDDPIQIEYFNSSGNPPRDAVSSWIENTTYNLLKYQKLYCKFVRSVPERLQHSNTECGMWSLLYIRSRLEDRAPNWFYKVKAKDKDMIAMRARLFRE